MNPLVWLTMKWPTPLRHQPLFYPSCTYGANQVNNSEIKSSLIPEVLFNLQLWTAAKPNIPIAISTYYNDDDANTYPFTWIQPPFAVKRVEEAQIRRHQSLHKATLVCALVLVHSVEYPSFWFFPLAGLYKDESYFHQPHVTCLFQLFFWVLYSSCGRVKCERNRTV